MNQPFWKKASFIAIPAILFFLIIEMGLRLLGFKPYTPNFYKIETEPTHLIQPHKEFGFGLLPGEYRVTLMDSLQFTATHTVDSTRITRSKPQLAVGIIRPKMFVMGCSFTYGFGIDDSLTFPFLLQQKYHRYNVYNFGIPGAGTVHSYLQLKRAIADGNIPDIVILNYSAELHDSRNALTRIQRQRWHEAFVTGDADARELLKESRFPQVVYNSEEFYIETRPMKGMYQYFPLRRYSAFVNLFETGFNHVEDLASFKVTASEWLIREMDLLCREHNIQLVVTGIMTDKNTERILEYCDELLIPNVNIHVDISQNQFNLRPWDGHPNAAANHLYFKKIAAFLQQERLVWN